MLFVVYEPSKKEVQKILRSMNIHPNVYSWSELLNHKNQSFKKKDRYTDEIFSLEFNTNLNSVKGKPGLKQCLFIYSDSNNEQVIINTFNVLEINP